MRKFIFKCNDKLLSIAGQTSRTYHPHINKYNKTLEAGQEGAYYSMKSEAFDGNYRKDYARTLLGAGFFSSPPGAYLNDKSIAELKGKIYTFHCDNFIGTSETPHTIGYVWPYRPVFVEWDSLQENVTPYVYPSGKGAKIIFGFDTNATEWDDSRAVIRRAADAALIPYNGNVLICLAGHGMTYAGLPVSGDEAIATQGPTHSTVPYYNVLLFNPEMNSESGLIMWRPSGVEVAYPSWISTHEASNTAACRDTPALNYNMTDAIEHHGRVYFANACDVLCWAHSGINTVNNIPPIEKFYSTDSVASKPSPKWFCKHDDTLYMYEGSGVLSSITPRDGITAPTKNNILSFTWMGTLHGGGIHGREYGIERATKSAIISYDDKLHVFAAGGSGVYHAYSSDVSTWYNISSGLPDIMRNQQGNVYTHIDNATSRLYVFYTTMTLGGILGVQSIGNLAANIGYLYYFDGTSWTDVGWYPIPSIGGAGGFQAYDPRGPAVYMPSGEYYAVSGHQTVPQVYKCSDYAVLDYRLVDKDSRNFDITVEYSIDDGSSWNVCRRFKSYETLQYLGDGITALSSSPSGTPHDFYWDFVNNLGYNRIYTNMKLRITTILSTTQ